MFHSAPAMSAAAIINDLSLPSAPVYVFVPPTVSRIASPRSNLTSAFCVQLLKGAQLHVQSLNMVGPTLRAFAYEASQDAST